MDSLTPGKYYATGTWAGCFINNQECAAFEVKDGLVDPKFLSSGGPLEGTDHMPGKVSPPQELLRIPVSPNSMFDTKTIPRRRPIIRIQWVTLPGTACQYGASITTISPHKLLRIHRLVINPRQSSFIVQKFDGSNLFVQNLLFVCGEPLRAHGGHIDRSQGH